MNRMSPADGGAILYVDDEANSRKWFARTFGDEFIVETAGGATDALALLARRAPEFAVLVTDYRMPVRDGMELLQVARREFRHLVRLLTTAYAAKEVAMAAVNDGKVLRILEKPLEEQLTREALREALALSHAQAMERAMSEGRAAAMREALGFLAHELNTPLATVRACMNAVSDRCRMRSEASGSGVVEFEERYPGEFKKILASAERGAQYCQSLVSTFVQSARDAYPGQALQQVSAVALVEVLLEEFPFEERERSWVKRTGKQDFSLPGRRDLLYLVLCTLTKNAIQAMRGTDAPCLTIDVGVEDISPTGDGRQARRFIRFTDNGPGIAPEVLSKLTREPVTTRADSGGNGMGLMFCHRVIMSLGGFIQIDSELGQGTTVTLYFSAA